ncbi:hypothetical protein KFE25_013277 [Diacronema lutheri]|uniref:NADP-dependent oxidoreductase domain-containing protein n=2 Tax=Diacronema lutheri TaxID=2081491 RepID=A0A8J5XQ72_DIALT|nr:hypothetical protein KFE25_013277 [Diacronema lutheri]
MGAAWLALAGAAALPAEPPGPNVTLLTGARMPLVGFGCAGRLGAAVLREAYAAGYRLFDTAQAAEWYDEGALGEALAGANGVFVTTKVHPRDFGLAATAASIDRSLAALRVRSIDLVMLHYPRCWGELCAGARAPEGDWRDAWRALEAARVAGKVRALGASNFAPHELDELWAHASTAADRPAVVQAFMDPLVQSGALRAWCAERGVVFQAYSTLGTQHALAAGARNPVLGSAALARIARARGRSVAQVVLRWAVQRGAAVIPRSADADRMRANLRLFDFALDDVELAAIDALDGADARVLARTPRAADAPRDVAFANGLDRPVLLRWDGGAGPAWTLPARGTLRLQSYASHAFWAAAAAAPAEAIWRWTVPAPGEAATGDAEDGSPLAVTIAPMAKTEL